MNNDTLRQFNSELTHLLSHMSTQQRRQLAKEITRDLHRSQIKRISNKRILTEAHTQNEKPVLSPYSVKFNLCGEDKNARCGHGVKMQKLSRVGMSIKGTALFS